MLLPDILEIRVLNVPTHTHKLKSAGKIIKPAKIEQLGQANQFSFNSSSLGYVRMLKRLTFTFSARDYLIDSAEAAVSLFHGVSLV